MVGNRYMYHFQSKMFGFTSRTVSLFYFRKALEAARKVKFRGTYFDLLQIYEYIQKKDYQYPSTPSLSHMFALDYQLDKILEEGLDNRFARHTEMADYVRAWAKEKFALFFSESK